MGIRATCANGHTLHVKSFLAGKVGRCPKCGAVVSIPDSEITPSADAIEGTGAVNPPSPPLPIAISPNTEPQIAPPRMVAADSAETNVTARATAGPALPEIRAQSRIPTPSPSRPLRDQRLVAARRRRQRMWALIVLAAMSVLLSGVLVWLLFGR